MIIKMDTNSDSEVTYYNITLDGEDISDTYDQSQIDYMAEGYSEMAAAFDTIDFDSEIDYIEGLDEDEISYEEDYFNYVDAVNGSVSINEEGNHFKFDENGVEFEMVVGTEE